MLFMEKKSSDIKKSRECGELLVIKIVENALTFLGESEMSIRLTLTMAFALALTLFTASCQILGHKAAKPSFAVSSAFEGNYTGERFDISGDQMCTPTKISGTVINGFARLRLHYNNTTLTGWIA